MQKTTNTQFGTFTYQSGTLEDFVEKFAGECGIKLSKLTPDDFGFDAPPSSLSRKGNGTINGEEAQFKYWVNADMSHDRKAQLRALGNEGYFSTLYNNANRIKEITNITIGQKYVSIIYDLDRSLSVAVLATDISDAVRKTIEQGAEIRSEPEQQIFGFQFEDTSPRKKGHYDRINSRGDMQNAFAFIRNYFGLKHQPK